MTVSESEQKNNQLVPEAQLTRAFRITMFAGIATMISGFVLPFMRQTEIVAYAFWAAELSAITQIIGALIIRQRRPALGMAIFFLSSPLLVLYIISQNSGIGILITAGMLVIYLLLLPQMLANTRQVVWAQLIAFVITAVLILVDLFWPVERIPVAENVFDLVTILLAILLVFFGLLTFRQFASFGLRGKLISTTLIVAVTAVILVAIGVNSLTRRALTVEVGSNLQTLAHSQALAIGELITRQINTLEVLALNRGLQDGADLSNQDYTGSPTEIEAALLAIDADWRNSADDDEIVQQYLNNQIASELLKFREAFPQNAEIFVTDRYGALIAATNRTTDFYQADEAWWQTAYNNGLGGVYLSNPTFDESINATGMQIAVPLFAHDSAGSNELVGIVRTTFTLGGLSDVLFSAQFEETGQAELYLPDGREFSALPDSDYVFDEIQLDEASVAELQQPDIFYLNLSYDERLSLVAMAPVSTLTHEDSIRDLGWHVLVRQANSESFASILAQQQLSAVLGLVIIMFAGGTAAFAGQRLTIPITRLTNVAEQFASGDLTVRASVESQDEIGTLATVFNSMAAQVSDFIGNLETRVQSRTHALETSIEVGRRLSTILDSQALVEAVVNQVRDAFNYYHVHIYLLDKDKETLVMAGGTGAAGQELLASGHKLTVGKGLVGQAALVKKVVLVPDVKQVEAWLPNPLLPDTQAEIAVPILLGNELLGVLDVQQNVTDGLQEEDASLLVAITNQVAISLENARLLAQVQKQAETEAQINDIGQRIQETTSVEEAMQIAIRELGRASKARQTSVRLATNKGQSNGDQK